MSIDFISKAKRPFESMVFVFVLVLSMLGTAAAQLSQNSDEPIDITAEKFEAFQEDDYGIWTGNVQVVQGEVLLTAPKLIIYGISEGNADKIEATGGMRYSNGVEAITGDMGVYDSLKQTITVTGNVIVVQGDQVMTGGRLIYNTNTGQMNFIAKKSGRVRGIFKTRPAKKI